MSHSDETVRAYKVLADERLGEDGFLTLRRLTLQVELHDGTLTKVGRYDFIERPMGRDAVVVVIWRRGKDGVEVLLRRGLRVPLAFDGVALGQAHVAPRPITELVAGILESGESDTAAIFKRAADEAYEEAGATVDASKISFLGAVMLPTPGMCPERFYFLSVEVDSQTPFSRPAGDGSPFEEGATLSFVALDAAIAACRAGEIEDLKTEVGLTRLRDHFADLLRR